MTKKLTLQDLQNDLMMQDFMDSNRLLGVNSFTRNALYGLISEDGKPSINNVVQIGDLALLKTLKENYEISGLELTKGYRLAMELGKLDMVQFFVVEAKQNINLIFKNELAHEDVKNWAINFQKLKELNKNLNTDLKKETKQLNKYKL